MYTDTFRVGRQSNLVAGMALPSTRSPPPQHTHFMTTPMTDIPHAKRSMERDACLTALGTRRRTGALLCAYSPPLPTHIFPTAYLLIPQRRGSLDGKNEAKLELCNESDSLYIACIQTSSQWLSIIHLSLSFWVIV